MGWRDVTQISSAGWTLPGLCFRWESPGVDDGEWAGPPSQAPSVPQGGYLSYTLLVD